MLPKPEDFRLSVQGIFILFNTLNLLEAAHQHLQRPPQEQNSAVFLHLKQLALPRGAGGRGGKLFGRG
jgi:hypothetical protein